MTKHRPNPYNGMGVDKLREAIGSKNYSGMTIKELECDDPMLAYIKEEERRNYSIECIF